MPIAILLVLDTDLPGKHQQQSLGLLNRRSSRGRSRMVRVTVDQIF